jgi:hypothetical protein
MLVRALLDEQEKRIRAHSLADICQDDFAANFAAFREPNFFCQRSLRNQRICQSDLFVNLERSRLDADRFRKRRTVAFFSTTTKSIPYLMS